MLHKVEIENFYSIGECQVIDLRARKSVEIDLGRLSPIYDGAEEHAPNVVALFGPNASGKSSILRTIVFGAIFMANSFDQDSDSDDKIFIPYRKFDSEEKCAEPSRLVLSFAGPTNFHDITGKGPQCPYTYELVLSPRGKEISDHVILEKMSYKPRGHGKPTAILERKANNVLRCARGFMSSPVKQLLKEILRPDASAISTLAQLNNDVAKSWTRLANFLISSNLLIGSRLELSDNEIIRWFEKNPTAFNQLKRIAKRIDLGIEDIAIARGELAPEPQLLFKHSGLGSPLFFDQESHGTQQFIKELPHILLSLDRGGIAVIDDFDATIHPLILPEILRWFGSKKYNPHNAQLWITCHSASLLQDHLTKEEVLFCQKDAQGRTSVYRLADIKGVRRSEDFCGKYLSGVYGAVPVIG